MLLPALLGLLVLLLLLLVALPLTCLCYEPVFYTASLSTGKPTVLLLLLVVTALAVDIAVALLALLALLALPILPVALLAAVLRVVPLAAVVRLLILRVAAAPAKGLAGLEGLGCGLERSGARTEPPLALLATKVHLLLGLARQVVVLGGRVILPGILDVGHVVGCEDGFWCRGGGCGNRSGDELELRQSDRDGNRSSAFGDGDGANQQILSTVSKINFGNGWHLEMCLLPIEGVWRWVAP